MSNPIQQAVQTNTIQGVKVNEFTRFYEEIGKHIFSASKYSAAIATKLNVVVEEGIQEESEFNASWQKFSALAIALAVSASQAVGQKLLNPAQDAAVLANLEALVAEAKTFIPLIDKLYLSYEGKNPTPAPSVTETANVSTSQEVILTTDSTTAETSNATSSASAKPATSSTSNFKFGSTK